MTVERACGSLCGSDPFACTLITRARRGVTALQTHRSLSVPQPDVTPQPTLFAQTAGWALATIALAFSAASSDTIAFAMSRMRADESAVTGGWQAFGWRSRAGTRVTRVCVEVSLISTE